MATITRENFVAVATQIAATATEYVTAAATEKVAIDKMIVYNTNTTTEVIKGYIETTAGSPGADDQVFEVSVPASSHLDVTEAVNLTLGNSQGLFLLTTTAVKVNLTIAGRRIVG